MQMLVAVDMGESDAHFFSPENLRLAFRVKLFPANAAGHIAADKRHMIG